jgi:hypothetical protein
MRRPLQFRLRTIFLVTSLAALVSLLVVAANQYSERLRQERFKLQRLETLDKVDGNRTMEDRTNPPFSD